MKLCRKSDYFIVDENQYVEILKLYGRDPRTIQDDVELIRNWIKTQPHFPEIPDDVKIENFLLLNKCSVERTKEKIDMYYSIRSILPDIYDNRNPKLPHMQKISDVMYSIPLPKLTPDHYRLVLYKFNDTNVENFDPIAFFAQTFNIAEIRLSEDLTLGDILIYDFAGCKLGHFTKITPTALAKAYAVVEKVFSGRLQGIHYLNCPSFIDVMVSIVKSVVKPKIAKRLFVHKDLDSLQQHFPKSLLPIDYGGEEKSIQELNEMIKRKLVDYQERFDLLDRLRVNEHLRPGKLVNDDLLGFHGNFKKLNVD